MRIQRNFVATIAAFSIAAAVASAQESSQEKKQAAEHMNHHQSASQDMHKIMHEGATMPMTMTGDVDRDFAAMMTMHHQQAIKMADLEIKHGRNPALKTMAEKMKASQKKEIEELSRFK